jgi:hypothetical protein
LRFESPTAGIALNAFSVPFLSDGERYHFITDNDCLILPDAGVRFDDLAVEVMEKNPDIWKLGAFLYRKVSPRYCARFAGEGLSLDHFMPIDWSTGERFCPDDNGMQDYADYTKTSRTFHARDPRIWMIPSDTTLSIVRNPHRVTEAQRLSPHAPPIRGPAHRLLGIAFLFDERCRGQPGIHPFPYSPAKNPAAIRCRLPKESHCLLEQPPKGRLRRIGRHLISGNSLNAFNSIPS